MMRGPVPEEKNLERGNVVVGALVMTMLAAWLTYATTMVSRKEIMSARGGLDLVKTKQIAQAGVEQGIAMLRSVVSKTSHYDPLYGVKKLFEDGKGGYQMIVPYSGQGLTQGGTRFGEFTVNMTISDLTATTLIVTVQSTGYFPYAPKNRPKNGRYAKHSSVEVSLMFENGASKVFDYGYFVNNWGWLYGDPIYINGNAGSNGQFDCGGYAPTITGQPTYDSLTLGSTTAALSGYHDTNGDGLHDGEDGGVFSGWNLAGCENVKGTGGESRNQLDFQSQMPMPNLTNLQFYEQQAIAAGANITIGGTAVADSVLGDDPGEKDNLYLVGTVAQPIVINGPVVVRGDVIIQGVVQGQGTIYSGRNVYVAGDLQYADPPTTRRPVDNTQAETETWIVANKDKDYLGLFAREHVVVGDFTDTSYWRAYIDPWISSSLNPSEEDAGADGIPNTRKGKDGISGTADDDLLDGDSSWTVTRYTAADQAAGVIPPGKVVGDTVPGTGEDIDGDGVQDGTTNITDFDLSAAISSTHWAGNVPSGTTNFTDISTNYIKQIDGSFYTNHAMSMYSSYPGITINGSLACRNEQLVFTSSMTLNYDCRLLGRSTSVLGDLLPRSLEDIEVISWRLLEADPNHDK